jgi:hypothetical protein
VKAIFAVVSGVLLMQTSIFMVSGFCKKVVATTNFLHKYKPMVGNI